VSGAAARVVAIDGPSGSGKSTVARRLAQCLDARYLDTGAMYRAVTLAVLRAGADPTDPVGVERVLAGIELEPVTDPVSPSIRLDGQGVDGEIRTAAVTAAVSAVSAIPAVRRALVTQQHRLIHAAAGRPGPADIVVEGRDIGTVVAPDAAVKVFLTASADARALRRTRETAGGGQAEPVDGELASTAAAMSRRDRLDSTRAASPLAAAPDALLLDTTALGIDEVVAQLLALTGQRA